MKGHEHKYIAGTIGDECEFCGLLKTTIEDSCTEQEPTEQTGKEQLLNVQKFIGLILAENIKE